MVSTNQYLSPYVANGQTPEHSGPYLRHHVVSKCRLSLLADGQRDNDVGSTKEESCG